MGISAKLGIISSSFEETIISATPGIDSSGFVCRLDAANSSKVITSGSLVDEWRDSSANGYNFVQTISGARPTKSGNSIQFDGTSQYMRASSTGDPNGFSFFDSFIIPVDAKSTRIYCITVPVSGFGVNRGLLSKYHNPRPRETCMVRLSYY